MNTCSIKCFFFTYFQGNYTIRNIDASAIAHMIFGNNFVYERGEIIIEYFTKAGYTFCLQLVIDTRPLIVSKKKYKTSNPFSRYPHTEK